MSRLQPVGQKRLTNICIVRLKKGGKRFEVAAYRNTVIAWRNKVEKDIDEVLQVHTIYANLDKGILAKSEDMVQAFGTDDEDVVCVEVLNKGEFQVSEEERQMMVDSLYRDVASRVADMCVNPETQLPYPLSTIDRAMRETLHFQPSTNRSAKMQALQVIRQLEAANVLPIARARMHIRLTVPTERLPAALAALHALGDGARLQLGAPESTGGVTTSSVACYADPGFFRPISELAREHGGSASVVELKSSSEMAPSGASGAVPPVPEAQTAPSAESGATADASMPRPPSSLPTPVPTQLPTPLPMPQLSAAAPAAANGRGTAELGSPGSSTGGAISGRSNGGSGGAAKPTREQRLFKLNVRNAEKGDPVAQLEVGKAYLDGVGVEVDTALGKQWLEQAAQQGVNAAVSRLEALAL